MAGFSLIELAIVLVILGLLVGGVLVGQSLIRAAELRSVSADFSRYESSIFTFRDKYFALPGDMPEATAFWGAADAGDGLGTDCHDATSNGTTTCNGNGNGRLDACDNSAACNAPEWFHSWVQLKNAGLVEGSYTGRRVGDPYQAVPGVNVPRSKVSNGGFTLMSFRPPNGDAFWYSGDYNPMLFFGAQSSTFETNGLILKAEEAWNMDTKLDDGRPGLGRVRTFHTDGNCVTPTGEANQNSASYNLTASAIACALIYSFNNPGE
jgi:prepilin-type N-terminal cleavage/methylation domain-containing protein